jgi:hypothetical protein
MRRLGFVQTSRTGNAEKYEKVSLEHHVLNIEAEVHDVTILHEVFLALDG